MRGMKVSVLRHSHRVLTVAALLGLIACKGSSSKKTGFADVTNYATPETNLSRYEYPFEKDGTYREDWAAGDFSRPDSSKLYASNPSRRKEKEKKKKKDDGPLLASTSPNSTYAFPPELSESLPSIYPPERARSTDPLSHPPPTVAATAGGGSASARVVETSARPAAPRPSTTPGRPSTASTSKAKSQAKPKSSKPAAAKPRPAAAAKSHTVKKGDTLYSLARRYGTSVAAIKKANGMKSDVLITGRTIRVPK